MTQDTFTWLPELGATCTVTPTISRIKLGDGYEQRIQLGINAQMKKWEVKFCYPLDDAMAILSFLRTCGGTDSFVWVDPHNESGSYLCCEWKTTQANFGIYEISATFEQVVE